MNRINLLAAFALAALAACSGGSSSPTFTATPPATQLTLKFDAQPSSGLAGEAMAAKVSIRDATGHVGGTGNVTVALGANAAGGPLAGTVTRAAVNGVATFDDLVIAKAGQGYTLTASGQGMTGTTTEAFSLVYSADENETALNANSNDSAAKAVAITPNVPMFGTMLASDDVDYYKFHATAGQILSVSSYATRLDLANWDTSLELRLVAPDGTTELQRMSAADWGITSIDNGFAGIRVPADGDYFLVCNVDASGSLISSAAKYALVLKLANPAAPQLEAQTGHDSIATAQAISPGMVAGQYQSPGGASASDSDFYKLTIDTVPTRIHLDVVGGRNGVANDGGAWDGMMELQDKDGTVLWHNDDTMFFDPAIDYVVTIKGDYYLRVMRVNGIDAVTAPYLLSYDTRAYSLPTPAGGSTTASAARIAYGQSVRTTFADPAGGQQFFAFDGNAGDLVRIWVDDKSVSQDSTLQMDPSLPADAMFVDVDDKGVVTFPSVGAQPFASVPASSSELNVRQTILQSGTHFVSVSSPAGGSFGFRLERVAAAGSAPGWISATLPKGATAADNKNHHTVHAEEGQLVTVSLFGGTGKSQNLASPFGDWGSAIVPTVQVLDGQGKVVSATSADRLGAANHAESMLRPDAMLETSFRAPTAGNYDVVVADGNGLGGPGFFYALQVWKNQ